MRRCSTASPYLKGQYSNSVQCTENTGRRTYRIGDVGGLLQRCSLAHRLAADMVHNAEAWVAGVMSRQIQQLQRRLRQRHGRTDELHGKARNLVCDKELDHNGAYGVQCDSS